MLGVGEGGAFPTATRAFTYWMPVAERGFAQGITHSFARRGGAVTPPLVLAVVATGGWRDAFILLGVSSQTLYRYVSPTGELRADGKKAFVVRLRTPRGARS